MNYPDELVEIVHKAKDLGWSLKKIIPHNFVAILHNGDSKANIYWNKKFNMNKQFTIQTTIDHPKKGRNQLNRKGIYKKEVIAILENPRKHTGKGYRKLNPQQNGL